EMELRLAPAVSLTEFPTTVVAKGLAIGPDANVWAPSSLNVYKITPAGVATPYAVSASSQYITSGPDGNLWFTWNSVNNGVLSISTAGVTGSTYGFGAGSISQGIATGPDGNLWVALSSANKIAKVSPTGGVLATYA